MCLQSNESSLLPNPCNTLLFLIYNIQVGICAITVFIWSMIACSIAVQQPKSVLAAVNPKKAGYYKSKSILKIRMLFV